jgi:hypothetical protein
VDSIHLVLWTGLCFAREHGQNDVITSIPYNHLEFTWTRVKSKVLEKNDTCKVADVGHVTYRAIDSTDFIVAGLYKPCQKLIGRIFHVTGCQM